MDKKLNSWEALKCNKPKRPAYGIQGDTCWLISRTLCDGAVRGEYLSKIERCLACKFFKRSMTVSSAKKNFQLLSRQLKEYANRMKKHENEIETINKELMIAVEEAKSFAQILHNIIDSLPDATFVIDKDKRVIEWNKAMEELTGVKKAEIIGKGDYAYAIPFYGYKRPMLIDLLNASDEDIEKISTVTGRKINAIFGEVYRPSFRKEKDLYLWAIASPILDKDGYQIGAVESIHDITEHKDTEKMLMDVNEKLRVWANELEHRARELAVLNEMGELIQSCISIDEIYTVISQAIYRLFPFFSGCLYMLNKPENQFENVSTWGSSLKSKETFKPFECSALKQSRIHISESGNKGLKCKHLLNGFLGNYICIPLIAQGESIGLLHLQIEKEQITSTDIEMAESRQILLTTITEHISLSLYNMKLRETLKYQAIRDPLTDLFNRRYMEETLEREMQRARRKETTVGLIMFDIDHFKEFNDTFGHAAGDTMLREIASFIKSNIRTEDIASRYGGEEFLITMPDATLKITRERAEKLRREVKKLEVKHRSQPLGAVTLSFGVAVFPKHAQRGEALIKAADKALYRAKAEGRDKVVVAE